MNHRLKEIRTLNGLNQTEMGEVLGLSLRGYQYLETGERDLSLGHIETIAKHFKIPSWYVLVDPKAVLDEFDREIVSRFHAAPPDVQTNIQRQLGMLEMPIYSQGPSASLSVHDKGANIEPNFIKPPIGEKKPN